MKKSLLIIGIVSLFAVMFLIPNVSADFFGDVTGAAEDLIDLGSDVFSPFLKFLVGDTGEGLLFAKALLLLLIYVVILTVLKRIELFRYRNQFAAILIAAVMSILAVRFMSESQVIEGILVPYGAMGIGITVFLPFLVYFFFVHYSGIGHFGRKVAWAIFALAFIGLWVSQVAKGSSSEIINFIYLSGLILVALAFIFDKQVQRYFDLSQVRKATKHMRDSQRVKLLNDYQRALRAFNQTGDQAAERELNRLARQLKINPGSGSFMGGAGI